jgi:hypothetical protein
VGTRYNRDRALAELLAVLAVEVLLEITDELGVEAAFAALVHVVERAAVGDGDADHAPLEHRVEIAGPRLGAQGELARRRFLFGGEAVEGDRGEREQADAEPGARDHRRATRARSRRPMPWPTPMHIVQSA